MKINKLTDIKAPLLFYSLQNFVALSDVYIKLEGLNIASSIKIKPAIWMIEALEQKGKLLPNISTAICSSSGNLGIALSIVCKQKGYPFICVSDPNISRVSENLINLYGGTVIKVTEADVNGGYLKSRLVLIDEMLRKNKNMVFIDQYENKENIKAHLLTTAYEIAAEFPKVDYLFIGAGTTGTLNGCSEFYKKHFPKTKIIAVDAVGSVTFDFPPAKRYIPGLGTSFKPKIARKNYLDDIILVPEIDTINMCHWLLKNKGLFLGGSSGSVLYAIKTYEKKIPENSIIVCISPDFGDKYIDTIYNTDWIKNKFPQWSELL